LLERGQALCRLLQGGLRLRHRGSGCRTFLDLDVTLNFELTQIAEQCARLRGETLGLGLERADPLVHAARHRIGRAAVSALGEEGRDGLEGRERREHIEKDDDDQESDKRKRLRLSPIPPVAPVLPHCPPSIESPVRIVGLDIGERRIGVAVSDVTGTLARPLAVLRPSGLDVNALEMVVSEIARLAGEDDGVGAIVVGLPRRLDGTATEMTPRVEQFARQLGAKTSLPVALQDERLSSREAESRLAVRDKDWRSRKARLDAAAAAVILQDYLDGRA
jgi:putative Holliday junction resolvase